MQEKRYIPLRICNGFVTARGDTMFCARLQELSGGPVAFEELFDLDELSETDRKLVVEGAHVVWRIGYTDADVHRTRESVIEITPTL